MKRSFVLAIVGTLSLAVVVAQDTTKVIDVEQLENNLFVLRGEGAVETQPSSSRPMGSLSSTRRTLDGDSPSSSRSRR